MDDNEHHEIRQQSIPSDEQKNGISYELDWLLRDLATQTFSLEQAAAGLERALAERRMTVGSKQEAEREAMSLSLRIRFNPPSFR